MIIFLFLGLVGCVDPEVTQGEDFPSPHQQAQEKLLLERTQKELEETKAALARVQGDLTKTKSALAETQEALNAKARKVIVATSEGEGAQSAGENPQETSLLEETQEELAETKATLAQVQAELLKTKEALAGAQKTSVTGPPRVLVAEEREREARSDSKERHENALRKIVESELRKTKATLAQVQEDLKKSQLALAETQEALTEAQEALAEQERKAQLEAEERKNTYIISANGGMFSVLATSLEAGSVVVSSNSALYFAEVRGPSCMKVKTSDFPQVVAKIMIKTPQGEYSLCDGDCVPSHYYFNETGPKTKEHKDEWVGSEDKKGRFEKYINIPLDENVMREVHIVREKEKIYEASSDDDFYVECERLYP